ncbi:MAG: hypothetical protein EG825_11820 [Rhodocyclaceae bacterium]|nr:hypothetical protein [Rhodocyclaceae bacterium]
MSANALPAKKPPEDKEPIGSETCETAADASPPLPSPRPWPTWARWTLRLALAAALLSLIGYFSGPAGVSPLLCKIYG